MKRKYKLKNFLFFHTTGLGWRTYSSNLELVVRGEDNQNSTYFERISPTSFNLIKHVKLPLLDSGFKLILKRAIFSITRLSRAFLCNKIATAHCAGHFMGLIPCLIRYPKNRIIVVDGLKSNDSSTSKITDKFVHLIEKVIFTNATEIHCTSQWCADSVLAAFGHQLDGSKVFVHPYTVRGPISYNPSTIAGPLNNVGNRKLRAVFVGNDFFRKGGNKITELAYEFSNSIEFHLYSSSRMTNSMIDSNSPPNLILHGETSNYELVNNLLQTYDFMLLPTYSDFSPLALIEGAACGLPLISSPIGGIPEIVRHGYNGYLIDPCDTSTFSKILDEFVKNPSVLEELSRNSRTHFEQNFNSLTTGRDYVQKLLSSGDPPAQ